MNIDGLISRATHTTGRTLLAIGSIVLLSRWYDYPIHEFKFLDWSKDVPVEMKISGTIILMVFLLLSHLLNWLNDYLGYMASFPLHAINEFEEPNMHLLSESGKSAMNVWNEHRVTIKASNISQKISLYFQHLLLPIACGTVAIYSLMKLLV